MPVRKQLAITAAAVAAAGFLVGGGVTAVSNASTTGQVAYTGHSGPGRPDGTTPGGHAHTAVTGDELAKVTAAVKAEDPTITIQSARKDPDGSYDVLGTKDGAPVMVEVSKDLKTIEARAGGPGGRGGHGVRGPRGMGGHSHSAVSGDELARVTAAVKGKDSTITIQRVQKDPDGSYDVLGTKDGAPVMVEVSKDLRTIEVRTGGPGLMRGPHHPGAQQTPSTSPSDGATTSTTSTL